MQEEKETRLAEVEAAGARFGLSVAFAVVTHASSPARPVNTLAWPAFITTMRALPHAKHGGTSPPALSVAYPGLRRAQDHARQRRQVRQRNGDLRDRGGRGFLLGSG